MTEYADDESSRADRRNDDGDDNQAAQGVENRINGEPEQVEEGIGRVGENGEEAVDEYTDVVKPSSP